MKAVVLVACLFISSSRTAGTFQVVPTRQLTRSARGVQERITSTNNPARVGTVFSGKATDDDIADAVPARPSKGFDGEGFAGYLAPYAAAFIASLLATGAFLKLVLLDG